MQPPMPAMRFARDRPKPRSRQQGRLEPVHTRIRPGLRYNPGRFFYFAICSTASARRCNTATSNVMEP
jgi:hypothetical protein